MGLSGQGCSFAGSHSGDVQFQQSCLLDRSADYRDWQPDHMPMGNAGSLTSLYHPPP
jgi:hypothetical protein